MATLIFTLTVDLDEHGKVAARTHALLREIADYGERAQVDEYVEMMSGINYRLKSGSFRWEWRA